MHCWRECKLVQPHYVGSFKKVKIEQSYDPPIPFLLIYPTERKTGSQRDVFIFMVIAELFTITKTWKSLKYPSMDKWIKKI